MIPVSKIRKELGGTQSSIYALISRCKPPLKLVKEKNRYYMSEEDYQRLMLVKHAKSRAEWRRCGFAVFDNAKPVGMNYGYRSYYDIYAKAQCRPIRRIKQIPAKTHDPNKENVMAAIFAVNRSAKRYRDAASTHYYSKCHGFARNAKEQKEKLYRLKDIGMLHAVKQGWLSPKEKHGILTLYRGDEYCFHSLYSPIGFVGETTETEEPLIEAKPRSIKEMRLKDAVATLEQLEPNDEGFVKAEFKQLKTSASPCWNEWDDDEDDDDDDDYYED